MKRVVLLTLAVVSIAIAVVLNLVPHNVTAQGTTPTPIWSLCPRGGDLPEEHVGIWAEAQPPLGRCVIVESSGIIRNIYDMMPEGNVGMIYLSGGWSVELFDGIDLQGKTFVLNTPYEYFTDDIWKFHVRSIRINRPIQQPPSPKLYLPRVIEQTSPQVTLVAYVDSVGDDGHAIAPPPSATCGYSFYVMTCDSRWTVHVWTADEAWQLVRWDNQWVSFVGKQVPCYDNNSHSLFVQQEMTLVTDVPEVPCHPPIPPTVDGRAPTP